MGEITNIKSDDNNLDSSENSQCNTKETPIEPAWEVNNTDFANAHRKNSQPVDHTEKELSFLENVQRAVEEVSSWPDWKVKNTRLAFSGKRIWTVEGKKSQPTSQDEKELSFLENVQRAVEEVSSWPDWKVKNTRLAFSGKRIWTVEGKKN